MPEDGEVSPVPPKSDIIPLDVVSGESETNGEKAVDSTGSDPKVSADSEKPQCNGLCDDSPVDGNLNANSVAVAENSVTENSVIVTENSVTETDTSNSGNGDDATQPVVDTDSGDVVTESDVKGAETSAGEEAETKTEEGETLDVATLDEKTGELVLFPPGGSVDARPLSEGSGSSVAKMIQL